MSEKQYFYDTVNAKEVPENRLAKLSYKDKIRDNSAVVNHIGVHNALRFSVQ